MKTLKKLLAAFVPLIIAVSCSSPPKLPMTSELKPSPADEDLPGYSAVADEGVYDNPAMRISARHLKTNDGVYAKGESGFITSLIEGDYVIIRLTIENKTPGSKIIFNPAYVARLQSDVARYGWSPHVSRLLFAWIWGYFFYFFFSSRRIWSRWRAPDLLTAGTPDYVLTGLALLLGGAGR